MIELHDISYVRLGTADLTSALLFVRDVVGLEVVGHERACCYFRSDSRDHTLVYFVGDPQDHTVGFDVGSMERLQFAASALSDAGFAVKAGTAGGCDQRRVHAFINFCDPTGNSIDLVVGHALAESDFEPPRTGGLVGFSHIGLCTTDAPRDERFWTDILGAKVSDRIGQAALLRIDPVHHKVALFPAQRRGVQHINHQMVSIDDVMQAWYMLKRKNVRIVFGPGRHPASGAVFVYFEGPNGVIYEYSAGVSHISPEDEVHHRPRQLPHVNELFCMWGATPSIDEFTQ